MDQMTGHGGNTRFSATEFARSEDPYAYMVETGFADRSCVYPPNELNQLKALISSLDDEHLALTFAIAERFDPSGFVDVACRFMTHRELSIRLGAFQTLVAVPKEYMSDDVRGQILEAMNESPNREDFVAYWQSKKADM